MMDPCLSLDLPWRVDSYISRTQILCMYPWVLGWILLGCDNCYLLKPVLTGRVTGTSMIHGIVEVNGRQWGLGRLRRVGNPGPSDCLVDSGGLVVGYTQPVINGVNSGFKNPGWFIVVTPKNDFYCYIGTRSQTWRCYPSILEPLHPFRLAESENGCWKKHGSIRKHRWICV